ncbi:MAG: flippase-like domain-containing protein [Ignavibacteria bacterium]|nr:flippase-like domain-containing protein [Ignavibacteria bacterium]
MLQKIKKNIFLSIAAAGAIYIIFIVYADYKQLTQLLSNLTIGFVLLVLSLSFTNYLFRFAKWHYYLHELRIKLSVRDSFSVFMSGLVMSITPGKMGELLKSYLVKQICGEPISKTAPIVFAERITDFLSLVFIAVIGAYQFDFGKEITIGVGVFFTSLVLIISQRRLVYSIFHTLQRFHFVEKHLSKLINAYESSYSLLQFRPLVLMTLVSIGSWFFECLGYYLILRNFGVTVSMLWASFAYAFGTIAGAITMLPAGLGVTEGSLTFLVINQHYAKDVAVATTFLIRVATLWFAVIVGICSVILYQKRFGKIQIDNH